MTQPPSLYSGVLTARSRRLRTVGCLLLLAIVGMMLYGLAVLMPAIHHYAVLHPITSTPHARKALYICAAFAYEYWGVCCLLIVAALFVAWLDFREISRNYIEQRRTLWRQVAGAPGLDADIPDRTSRKGSS